VHADYLRLYVYVKVRWSYRQSEKKLFSGPSSTGWAKNRTCLSVDNSAMVTVERPVICQKFWNVVDKESLTCIANHLNILRLICVNLHCP